ncbi:MAG: hypothetical protein L3J56_06150 [Bacteroidales bacterium]|nr:hypothetical protein [Bacteroidales bacterium]
MRQRDRIIKEMYQEYLEKGYSLKSDKILLKQSLKTELISKACGVYFIKILNKAEDEIIRIEHSQLKKYQYKFYKSVKKYASGRDKAGQSKEIYECLNTLKERYKNNPAVEDIEHYDKHIELSCISETDPDLRVIFRIHPKNTSPQFSYDLSMRHYKEFFKYSETIKGETL